MAGCLHDEQITSRSDVTNSSVSSSNHMHQMFVVICRYCSHGRWHRDRSHSIKRESIIRLFPFVIVFTSLSLPCTAFVLVLLAVVRTTGRKSGSQNSLLAVAVSRGFLFKIITPELPKLATDKQADKMEKNFSCVSQRRWNAVVRCIKRIA